MTPEQIELLQKGHVIEEHQYSEESNASFEKLMENWNNRNVN
jgi:hypothetical protein